MGNVQAIGTSIEIRTQTGRSNKFLEGIGLLAAPHSMVTESRWRWEAVVALSPTGNNG